MEFCHHLSECGGCSMQEVPYEEQLKQKQMEIEKIFSGVRVEPIIPCMNPWRYRNKMEFSFSQNKAGDRFLGLIMRKSRGKVVNLHECLISPCWFTEVLKRVKKWWEESSPASLAAFNFRNGEGCLRTLTLREGRRTGDRLAMLTVSGDPRFAMKRGDLDRFVEIVGEMSVFLRIQQARKGKPTEFFEMHLKGADHVREKMEIQGKVLTFKISPTSFFQPNTDQAEVLYNTALEMCSVGSDAVVYDLYCGTATLGMGFALMANKVVGIEINPHAIFDAKANAEENQISNMELICGDVGTVLSQMKTPDLAIVDPPRSGLDGPALEALKKLAPKKILYISCNPTTQAKNIAELTSYKINTIQPVDQFPHTPHIENIVLLDSSA